MSAVSRFLLGIAVVVCSILPARGQTAGDVNEGLVIHNGAATGDFVCGWWGRAGRTYFIQTCGDMSHWSYVPVIESGNDEVIEWGFASTAERLFVRLIYTDEAYSGAVGDADFDGDGLTNNAELVSHATNPLAADSDGDGGKDGYEVAQGTDPNDGLSVPPPDSDDDGVPDELDAVPYDPNFKHAPSPGGRHYAVIDIAQGSSVMMGANGHLLWQNAGGIHYREPEGATTDFTWNDLDQLLGSNREAVDITGISPEGVLSGRLTSYVSQEWAFAYDPRTGLGGALEELGSAATYELEAGGDLDLGALTPAWGPEGKVYSKVRYRFYNSPSPSELRQCFAIHDGGAPQRYLDGAEFAAPPALPTEPPSPLPPENDYARFQIQDHVVDWKKIEASGGGSLILRSTREWHEQYERYTNSSSGPGWSYDVTPQSYATEATYEVLSASGTRTLRTLSQGSNPFLIRGLSGHAPWPWLAANDPALPVNPYLGVFVADRLWVPDAEGAYTAAAIYGSKGQYEAANPLYEVSAVNAQAVAWACGVMADGTEDWGVWANGEGTALEQMVGEETYNRYTNWTFAGLSNQGLIAMRATRIADNSQRVLMLAPVEVVTRGVTSEIAKTADSVLRHAEAPKIHLDTVTTSNVTIVDGMASLTLSGEITDAIMSAVPAGKGADVLKVRTYVNGEPSDNEVSGTRQSLDATFWMPHACKSSFQNLVVNFPASGLQRITVETEANAAGVQGTLDLEVAFQRQPLPATVISAQSKSYEITLPASLSAMLVEVVECIDPASNASIELTETEVDSRLFESADETVCLWLPDYQLTGDIDTLDCVLSAPGLPTNGGALSEGTMTCQETAATSLHFVYTRTTGATQMSAGFVDSLESVDLIEDKNPASGFPFALRLQGTYGEEAKAQFLDAEFPLVTPEGAGASYVLTDSQKPMIGFMVAAVAENGAEELQFLYYDEQAAALKRVARPASQFEESFSFKTAAAGGDESGPINLPLRHLRLVDSSGAPSGGYAPVDIDALIAISQGDTFVEIADDSQMTLEITGGRPGEVIRVFSDKLPQDAFELTVPGENPAETTGARTAEMVSGGDSIYRTQQKVVVYSTGPEDPQQLTDEQWQTLKALGILAVHNETPLARMALDDLVPPEGAIPPNLLPGTRKPKDYRFPGYEDHHLINVYHENKPKALKWKNMLKTMFGDDFDPDAFTVPLKTSAHKGKQHLATEVWDDFIQQIEPNFDANGKILSTVSAETVADLRADTMKNMRTSLAAMVGSENVDACMGRIRIWPGVLEKSSPLKEAFLKEGYKMGSSANRFSKFCAIATKGLQNASKVTDLKKLSKSVLKSAMKNGTKIALLTLASVLTKTYAVVDASIDVTQYGWQEALAIRLNDELALNDIELARYIVSQSLTSDEIPGGVRTEALTLANGQVIRHNDLTFRCYWDATGHITNVETFIVTEIKTNFSNNDPPKIAIKRLDDSGFIQVMDKPAWVIQDWWPHKGASSSDYQQAQWRAMNH